MSDEVNTPAEGAETTALPTDAAPTPEVTKEPEAAPVPDAEPAPAPDAEPPKADEEAHPRTSKRTAA